MVGGKRIAHKKKTASVAKEVPQSDDDLWKRLEELEQQEEDNKEIDNIESIPQDGGTVINVKHSAQTPPSSLIPSRPGVITSPADICVNRHNRISPPSDQPEEMATTTTKSVHWSQDITSTPSLPQGNTKPPPLTPLVKPFTGSVMETSHSASQTVSSSGF